MDDCLLSNYYIMFLAWKSSICCRVKYIIQALARLENPAVLGITTPEDEKKKIKTAVKLWNQTTPFEFELTEEHAMAKFSEIFAFLAFLVYFQGRYLKSR